MPPTLSKRISAASAPSTTKAPAPPPGRLRERGRLRMGVKVIHRPPDNAARLGAGLAPVMRRAAVYLQSSADKKISSGISPANAPLTQEVKQGSQTLRDMNTLAQSVAPHSGSLWADASTNLHYAHVLQEGKVINSKGKGLWIPASAKTREMMRRYNAWTPGKLIAAMKADGYAGYKAGKAYFIYKKGRELKSGKRGKRGQEFILFIIKDSVEIKPRPFLYIDEKDEVYLMKLIRDGVAGALRGKP
jgi:phage gpG-like protein